LCLLVGEDGHRHVAALVSGTLVAEAVGVNFIHREINLVLAVGRFFAFVAVVWLSNR
jgi:hypothetical protein